MRKKWQLEKVPPGVVYERAARELDETKDPEHLAWIRTQRCAVAAHRVLGAHPCQGPIEAHHSTARRGRGQKAADREAFPLCLGCHHDFHAAVNTFRDWKKEHRRAWQDRMVAIYRAGPRVPSSRRSLPGPSTGA